MCDAARHQLIDKALEEGTAIEVANGSPIGKGRNKRQSTVETKKESVEAKSKPTSGAGSVSTGSRPSKVRKTDQDSSFIKPESSTAVSRSSTSTSSRRRKSVEVQDGLPLLSVSLASPSNYSFQSNQQAQQSNPAVNNSLPYRLDRRQSQLDYANGLRQHMMQSSSGNSAPNSASSSGSDNTPGLSTGYSSGGQESNNRFPEALTPGAQDLQRQLCFSAAFEGVFPSPMEEPMEGNQSKIY